MGLRQAYEMVIKHQLELMIDEKGWDIPEDKLEKIAKEMADDSQYLESLLDFTEDHLDSFSSNYWEEV